MSKGITLLEIAGMNRHARRALAKANKVGRIAGTSKPIVSNAKNLTQ